MTYRTKIQFGASGENRVGAQVYMYVLTTTDVGMLGNRNGDA
jgi:hypothetical protein